MRRRSRQGRGAVPITMALTLLLVLALAAAVLAAQGVVQYAEAERPPPSIAPQLAAIEQGAVVVAVDGTVRTERSQVSVIRPPAAQGAAIQVVTRTGLARGGSVKAGGLIGVVAERPIFALPGAVPAYRALATGDSGVDVAQLQKALKGLGYSVFDREGAFGRSTSSAVKAFYRDREFTAAAGDTSAAGGAQEATGEQSQQAAPSTSTTSSAVSIPLGEVQFIPSLPAKARGACGEAGQPAGQVLCELAGGAATLVLRVPRADADQIKAGLSVRVTTSQGKKLAATVGERIEDPASPTGGGDQGASAEPQSEAQAADQPGDGAEAPADALFELRLDKNAAAALAKGDISGRATVTVAASPKDAMRVLAAAIRQGPDLGTYLQRADGGRIDVEVGVCAGGFCEITGTQATAGTQVVLTHGGAAPATVGSPDSSP